MVSRRVARPLAVLLPLSIAAFTGCGGGEGDTSGVPEAIDDGGEDPGAATGEESDAAASNNADFPIAIPDGLLLDAHADVGLEFDNQRQLFYPADDVDRVVAFYDEWTSQDGGSWARTELDGAVTFTRTDGEFGSIIITPEHDPGAQADEPVTLLALAVG